MLIVCWREIIRTFVPRKYWKHYKNILSISVAARSKAWVCSRSLAGICGFNSPYGDDCLSVVSVVCCQVEVSATGWSLVQRSSTECCVWVWSRHLFRCHVVLQMNRVVLRSRSLCGCRGPQYSEGPLKDCLFANFFFPTCYVRKFCLHWQFRKQCR